MKKYLFLFIALFFGVGTGFAQTTATDFTTTDCSGISHHLFGELDAGKVIVASFVEPCSACIGPSANVQSAVAGYSVTNPGSVLFYVVDDAANTSCTTLQLWSSHNGLTGANAIFSDPAFVMSQYGTPAMPKIIVLGGPGHHVFLSAEGAGLTTSDVQSAINSALASTFVPIVKNEGFDMNVYPNPAKEIISFSYSLAQATDVTIELYNIIGSKIYAITKEKQGLGKHDLPIPLGNNISNGIYIIKLTAGQSSEVFKFVVEK